MFRPLRSRICIGFFFYIVFLCIVALLPIVCVLESKIAVEPFYFFHAKDVYADTDRIAAVNGDAENLEQLKAVMPGQNVVYCAISGEALPKVAENILDCRTFRFACFQQAPCIGII